MKQTNQNTHNENVHNQSSPKHTSDSLKDYALIVLKGMAMGTADIVPGISGGTIALITGIYTRFINALSTLGPQALKILFTQGFAKAWKHVDASFLVALGMGIAISLFSLANTIKWLLANEAIGLWGFFFGLVLASIVLLIKELESFDAKSITLLVIGAVIAAGISLLPSTSAGELSYIFLFFAGAIAICALMLPGISGSFLLVLMGAYDMFLTAISTVNLVALGSFFAGAVVSLLTFSRFLKWLLAHYYTATISLMVGFVLGSLMKVWPWKITGSELPALPHTDVSKGIICIVTGFAFVVILEYVAKRINNNV